MTENEEKEKLKFSSIFSGFCYLAISWFIGTIGMFILATNLVFDIAYLQKQVFASAWIYIFYAIVLATRIIIPILLTAKVCYMKDYIIDDEQDNKNKLQR